MRYEYKTTTFEQSFTHNTEKLDEYIALIVSKGWEPISMSGHEEKNFGVETRSYTFLLRRPVADQWEQPAQPGQAG